MKGQALTDDVSQRAGSRGVDIVDQGQAMIFDVYEIVHILLQQVVGYYFTVRVAKQLKLKSRDDFWESEIIIAD